MLNPTTDRFDYGAILTPPGGYVLDKAICTTYSLDLDALIGCSVALGLSEQTDSDLMRNPLYLLQALQEVGDKLVIFCEGGQIKYPSKPIPLYVLLEKMVFPVKTEKRKMNRYPSFHPKTWVIKYQNASGDAMYRVVVMSRNLTFDRSWDVVVSMEGQKGRGKSEKSQPLVAFLKYLYDQIDVDNASDGGNAKAKQSLVKDLLDDINKVEFRTDSKAFPDFEFLPSGIRKNRSSYYDLEATNLGRSTKENISQFDQLLIISPFLSNGILRRFNNESSSLTPKAERILISRRETLAKLRADSCNNFKKYALKETIIDGETAISEDNSADAIENMDDTNNAVVQASGGYQRQDIHAKVFMWHRYSDSQLYLGSLNCSENAWSNNIEFMLCLHSKNRYLNLNILKDSLFCENDDKQQSPFEQVYLPVEGKEIDDGENSNSYLDDYLKGLNRLHMTAEVIENGSRYDIKVTVENLAIPDGYTAALQPLLYEQAVCTFSQEMYFKELAMSQLSEFYVLSVADASTSIQRVIKICTKGIPEQRETKLIKSIINNKELFYRYIAYLLGDRLAMASLDNGSKKGNSIMGNGDGVLAGLNIPPIYEKLLVTAYEQPDNLDKIRKLVEKLRNDEIDSKDGMGQEIIPQDFIEMYDTFAKVVMKNAER